jgi:hypothetical protein
MAKQWRVFAHPGWFPSLRQTVPDRNERYQVVNAIEERLKNINDPSQAMTPVLNGPHQYEFDVLRYTVIIRWRTDQPSDIALLEIY